MIDSSIDLLDDGAFNEVARPEIFRVDGMEFSGCGNLGPVEFVKFGSTPGRTGRTKGTPGEMRS